jgi:hypothetical protein
MPGKSSESPDRGGRRLQRAVVLELLSADSAEGLTTAQLAQALGADGGELDRALGGLAAAGVLESALGSVQASTATRRLDELELIAI